MNDTPARGPGLVLVGYRLTLTLDARWRPTPPT